MSNHLKHHVRSIRKSMTDGEKKLWDALKREALGVKFRRQVLLGPHLVTFACLECKLAIEVMVSPPAESTDDHTRETWLTARGFQVLRFWDHEIIGSLPNVLKRIRESISNPAHNMKKVRR